ncbi:MFS transporter [Enterococcus gallinarum]|uniref:MFS transporter n=1 Tax=Enterococcus gallinarum TaxID=1353 RepID=UPI001C107BE1|nr:MFS transporter [Enterococcus gallinarum]MBU5359220.1 MFS transporter [Enterococcus gallinarum]
MNSDRLKVSEKLGFALTNLGNIPIMTLLNTYLLIFYTDVIGVNPALVGMLFLVSRLLDGVSDPLIGFVIDRFPRTKIGKYKPVLILGVIICCLNYLLVWFSPLLFPAQKIIAISISYILLGITFDFMDIPLNSLIPVLTQEDEGRNQLSSIKGISYTVGPAILNVAAPLAIAAFATSLKGYVLLIVGTVLVVLFFTIVGTLMVKERGTEAAYVTKPVKEKYTMKDALSVFKLRPVVSLFLAMLFITAATNIFNGSLLYYLSYIISNPKLLSAASFLGMLGFLVINHHSAVFVLCYCGVQFALGLTNTLQYSISADNVDTIRNELDIEATALIASLTSLIMKFAMAIGGAVPGFVLSFTGYAANQSQSSTAEKGILFVTFVIPLILYVVTIAVFSSGFKSNKIKSLHVQKRKTMN